MDAAAGHLAGNGHAVKLDGALLDNRNSTGFFVTKAAVSTRLDVLSSVLLSRGREDVAGRALDKGVACAG